MIWRKKFEGYRVWKISIGSSCFWEEVWRMVKKPRCQDSVYDITAYKAGILEATRIQRKALEYWTEGDREV